MAAAAATMVDVVLTSGMRTAPGAGNLTTGAVSVPKRTVCVLGVVQWDTLRRLATVSLVDQQEGEKSMVAEVEVGVGEEEGTPTARARPTLICRRGKEYEGDMEGEFLGAKGVEMDLLHRRLGHTS